MKRIAIVLLVALNLALVAAVVFHAAAEPATAQVVGGGADYVTMTTTVGSNEEVLLVIDLRTRRLGAWQYDHNRRQLIPYAGRDLARDFQAGR